MLQIIGLIAGCYVMLRLNFFLKGAGDIGGPALVGIMLAGNLIVTGWLVWTLL